MVTQGRAGSVGPDGLQKILWTRSLWEDQPALPWAVDPSVPCCPRSGGVLTAADCGLLGVRDSVRLPLPPRALAQVLSQWPAHRAQSVPRTYPGTRTHRKDSNSDCLPHITCLPHHRVPWPFVSPPHSPASSSGVTQQSVRPLSCFAPQHLLG